VTVCTGNFLVQFLKNFHPAGESKAPIAFGLTPTASFGLTPTASCGMTPAASALPGRRTY